MAMTSEVNQMRGEIQRFNYDFIEKGKKECKGRWLYILLHCYWYISMSILGGEVKVKTPNHNYNEIERKNKNFLK